MQLFRYSKHPPAFYTYRCFEQPSGIGSTEVAQDPGLWNLTWIMAHAVFAEYESGRTPDTLKTLSAPDLASVVSVSRTRVEGKTLRDLAASNPLRRLIKIVDGSGLSTCRIPTGSFTWDEWLARAKGLIRKSSDQVASFEEFEQPVSIAKLRAEAAALSAAVSTFPAPLTPNYDSARQLPKLDYFLWLSDLQTRFVE